MTEISKGKKTSVKTYDSKKKTMPKPSQFNNRSRPAKGTPWMKWVRNAAGKGRSKGRESMLQVSRRRCEINEVGTLARFFYSLYAAGFFSFWFFLGGLKSCNFLFYWGKGDPCHAPSSPPSCVRVIKCTADNFHHWAGLDNVSNHACLLWNPRSECNLHG